MLRFILKHKQANSVNGFSVENFFTVDGDFVKLEKYLTSGGFGEYGYEHNELVGVEVIYEPQTKITEPQDINNQD